MISVGIIGGSGYTGKKLVQYSNNHPYISDYKVYGNTSAGKTLNELFPELEGIIVNSVIGSSEEIALNHDVYFIALPHGEAMNYVPSLVETGKIVIDLGGDYRLNSKDEYEKWYKKQHTSPELLNKKVYGLADYYGTDYSISKLIANPGCYPTATLLALLPLVNGFGGDILSAGVSAYSGTSGAGKSPKTELMVSEMDGNVKAYNVLNHRHQPEIHQLLKGAGLSSPFSFTTHLLPIAVGIYATATVHMNKAVSEEEVKSFYASSYADFPFVRLRDVPPNLSWVVDTNFCDINVAVKDNTIIVTSAIDNLVKGASGQAFQNLNKIFGWDEELGISKLSGVKNASVY